MLITLDVEGMYTIISQAKGLQAVREVMTRCPLYESIIDLLDLSVQSNDFMFDDEWYIQKVGTSVVRDWVPHYAAIYMAKIEKEILLKCPLKQYIYDRYLDDIVIFWPHSMDALSVFLDIFNTHKLPIKFKSSVSNIDYLDALFSRIPTTAKHY